jgi:hypothetical protein
MNSKNSLRILFCMVLTMTCLLVSATNFTILFLNTPSVQIGGKTLKVGDSFSESDISSIKWKSNKQLIKVRNESSKRTLVLTQRNSESEGPSLKNYLTKKKILAARSYSDLPVKTAQLLDSISFDITETVKDSIKYIAVWHDGDYRVRTLLPLSGDKKRLCLTRSIYGHHTPREAEISILKYDLKNDSEPENLGYMLIEPLPFVLP